jgi:hypothetical protein
MAIGAGHVTIDPEQRACYLAGSISVVERARQAADDHAVNAARGHAERLTRLAAALNSRPDFQRRRSVSAIP